MRFGKGANNTKEFSIAFILFVIALHFIGSIFLVSANGGGAIDLTMPVLLDIFATYIAVFIAVYCFREYYLNRLPEFNIWGIGSLVFFVLFGLKILSSPDILLISNLEAKSSLLDLVARLFFGSFLFLGFVKFKQFFLNRMLLWSGSALLLTAAIAFIFNFNLPSLENISSLKLSNLGVALVYFASVGFLLTTKKGFELQNYFWLAIAAILGGFSGVYFFLAENANTLYLSVAHFLKPAFLSFVLVGLASYKNRVLRFDRNLAQSLEEGTYRVNYNLNAVRDIVENLPEGVFVADLYGTVKFANLALSRLLNYDKADLLGLHMSIFFEPQSYEKFTNYSAKTQEKSHFCKELELVTKDNQKIPVLLKVQPLKNSKSQPAGNQFFVSGIADRQKIEQEWQSVFNEKNQSLRVFQQCVEYANEGIMITSTAGKINYANRSFEKMSGYLKSELIGKDATIFVHDDESKYTHEKIWDFVKENRIWKGELPIKRKDISVFFSETSVIPIEEKSGVKSRCLWIQRDVTERKTLEGSLKDYAEKLTTQTNQLESTKAYYESLISGMSDILLVVDNDSQCTFINEYGRQQLGFRAADLTKKRLPVFFNDLRKLEKNYGAAIQVQIKDFESTIQPRKGDPILCSWYARPLFDRFNRRVGAMAVGRDITEYKKMQDELQGYAKNLEGNVEERTVQLEQRVIQMAKLLEIGEEIRLNVDVDVLLNKICESILLLGWGKAVISLRNSVAGTSRPVATAGLDAKEVEQVMTWGEIPFEHTNKYFKERFRISHSYFIPKEEELVTEETQFSIYTEFDERLKEQWQSLDALLVPIRTKDRILGVITVDNPADKRRPDLDRIRELEIFSDKAALAIENSRMYLAQKESEKQSKFLAEIGKIFHSTLKMQDVLDAVTQMGGTAIGEFCSLLLLDEKSNALLPDSSYHNTPHIVDLFVKGTEEFPCRPGVGIVGSCVTTGKASLHSAPFAEDVFGSEKTIFSHLDEYNPISSIMIVPLNVRRKTIGVMIYLLFETRRKYKKDDLKLAQELADRAALAIENAKLFKEASKKAEELETVNKLKSEFLASVSHELRTPLNAIITLSEIMVENFKEKDFLEELKQIQIIQRSGRNLLNLINDILDLSKIEAGKVDPVYSVIPIQALVAESIEHVRPLCNDKGLTLEYEFAKNVPNTIYCDQNLLSKALNNILSNAIKFTRAGKVTVDMRIEDKKKIRIDVCDTGIGIPADRLEEIFREFQQVDNTDARAYSGTGLGLAITKRVLGIIEGEVLVKSQLGKGSTFSIIIPIKSKNDFKEAEKNGKETQLTSVQTFKHNFELEDDREKLQENKKTILIIDDENDSLYIMSHYLRENNYQIIFPQEAESILDLIEEYKPFAVTLDIIMPNQSGWEILQGIKNTPEIRETPVIMTSILSERGRALEMGAAEYFVKPFDPQGLLDFLAKLAEKDNKKSGLLDLSRFLNLRKKTSRLDAFKAMENMNGGASILVVDDDDDSRYALGLMLQDSGYKLHFARDGREGLRLAETVGPELILMDMMMPGMDGYEATRTLKAQDKFKDIPVIAVTAKAMKGDREKTIESGCDDYVAKPFDGEEIQRVIIKWLAVNKVN